MYLGGVTTVPEQSSNMCLSPKRRMDHVQVTPQFSTSDQHLLDWRSINWERVLLLSSFNPSVNLESNDHLMTASDTCPKMQMNHNFPRAIPGQIQHTLQASIHMSSCTQICWIILPLLWKMVLGSVKITTSFTRRKNELLDQLGNTFVLPQGGAGVGTG